MNDEEMDDHEWLKNFFGFKGVYGEDSQTVKQAERTARNVLQKLIGIELKEIFQRKSKDELSKFRKDLSVIANKGITSINETAKNMVKKEEKGSAEPSFKDVLFN